MNEISRKNDNSNNNCVVCINATSKTTKIFSERGEALKIAETLCQHFWFTFDGTDKSQEICVTCWEKVDLFHQFYESVREAHRHRNENRPQYDDSVEDDWQLDYYDTDDEMKSDNEDAAPETSLQLSQPLDTAINTTEYAERIGQPLDSTIKTNGSANETKQDTIAKFSQTLEVSTKATEDAEQPLDSTINVNDKQKNRKWEKLTADLEERVSEFFKMNCDLCGEQLSSLRHVTGHFRTKHNLDRGYLICSCNKKATVRTSVIEHVQWHMNPNMFRCEECWRTFIDKRALRKHKVVHQAGGKDLFGCSLCTKQFSTQSSLTQHVLRVHPSDNQKFTCDICEKNFKLKIILDAHIKYKHSGTNQQYICDICAKVLSTKQSLREHANTHIDTPYLQCDICGAYLKNRLCLTRHFKSHTGTKQTCDICFQVKANWPALMSHKRRVHGTAQHKCNLCEKAFNRLIALKEHIATHTGESLYTCNYCPQNFKSNSNMYKHMKQVHLEQWTNDRKKRK